MTHANNDWETQRTYNSYPNQKILTDEGSSSRKKGSKWK